MRSYPILGESSFSGLRHVGIDDVNLNLRFNLNFNHKQDRKQNICFHKNFFKKGKDII